MHVGKYLRPNRHAPTTLNGMTNLLVRQRRWLFLLALAALVLLAATRKEPQVHWVGLFGQTVVLTVDGKQCMLTVGGASVCGIRLLKIEEDQVQLEVAGVKRIVTLSAGIASQQETATEALKVYVYPDPVGMYRANGTINGSTVEFLVDTGATHVVMSAKVARQLNIDFRGDGTASFAYTASGVAKTFQVSLERVSVGAITLRHVPALVMDGEHPTEVLLGMSFLSQIGFSNQGKMMILTPR